MEALAFFLVAATTECGVKEASWWYGVVGRGPKVGGVGRGPKVGGGHGGHHGGVWGDGWGVTRGGNGGMRG